MTLWLNTTKSFNIDYFIIILADTLWFICYMMCLWGYVSILSVTPKTDISKYNNKEKSLKKLLYYNPKTHIAILSIKKKI